MKKSGVVISCSVDLMELEEYLKGTDLMWSWRDDEDVATIEILIPLVDIPDEVWKALNQPISSKLNPMERSDLREEREEEFCDHYGINFDHVVSLTYV